MLAVTKPSEFQWVIDSHVVRPAVGLGATVTPGNNTKGAYAQVATGAQVTHDVWMIDVCIHSLAVAATAKDALFDIGFDPAGGTTYSVLIPDLLGSCAATVNAAFGARGINYRFPLHIPAGSSIAARGAVNNATPGTGLVFVRLYGKPSQPELVWKGSVVQAIGVTPATSSGTGITAGTTSDGTWTSLGTLTRDAYWFQMGMGCNDSTMSTVLYGMELSTGSTSGERILIPETYVYPTTSESLSWAIHDGGRFGKAGETVWARCQVSSTADALLSAAAWAVT